MTIFLSGSTAAVTTIEYEPGLRKDFPAILERVATKGIDYKLDNTWHDGNGHSHVRASLIGPSLTVPFKDKRLMLPIRFCDKRISKVTSAAIGEQQAHYQT